MIFGQGEARLVRPSPVGDCSASARPFRGVASVLALAVVLGYSHPGAALACAACYGQSDSPMAAAMNWGILTLLAVIVAVLGGIAAFFAFLARRAAGAVPAASESASEKSGAVPAALRHRRRGIRSPGLAPECVVRPRGVRAAGVGLRPGIRLWVFAALPRRRGRLVFGLDHRRNRPRF